MARAQAGSRRMAAFWCQALARILWGRILHANFSHEHCIKILKLLWINSCLKWFNVQKVGQLHIAGSGVESQHCFVKKNKAESPVRITENSSVQSRNEVFFTLKKTYTIFNSEVWRMSPLGLGRKQRYDLLFSEDWTFQGERWTGKLGKTLKWLEKKNTLIIWRDECVQRAQKNMKTINCPQNLVKGLQMRLVT